MNPAFFAYSRTTNLEAWSGPSAVIVTGRGNRLDPAFQRCRENGAEVYAYLNVAERPDSITHPLELEFYLGGPQNVPLWTPRRSSWPKYAITDITPGSAWATHCIEFIAEKLIRSGLFDGVFLDVIGAQLWGAANFTSWPTEEQKLWADSNVDFVRRLDERRRQVNPDFKIVNNNLWQKDRRGEQYVDGICIENPTLGAQLPHRNEAKRVYGSLGQRRVIVITRNDEDATLWAAAEGVTHVASVFKDGDPSTVDENYQVPTPAVVPLTDIRLPELRGKVERLRLQLAEAESGGAQVAELQRQLEATRVELAATYDQLAATTEDRNALAGRVDAQKTKLNTLSEQLSALAEVARE